MPYSVRIVLAHTPEPLVVPLPGVELERAEQFTAELRYEIEEGKNISSPVTDVKWSGIPEFTLEPLNVIAIDLVEDD